MTNTEKELRKLQKKQRAEKRKQLKQQGEDIYCTLEKPCEDYTRTELKKLANECNERQISYAEYIDETPQKPFSPRASNKTICRWMHYLQTFRRYDDIPTKKIKDRVQRLENRKDLDEDALEEMDLCNPYEYEGGSIGVYDLLYFLKTYGQRKSTRIFFPCSLPKDGVKEHNFKVMWFTGKEGDCKNKLRVPRGLIEQLQSFNGKWMAVFMTMKQQGTKHANLLFYYPKTRTIERYDPAGARYMRYNGMCLDKRLDAYFRKYNILYIPPVDYLPRRGFDAYAELDKKKETFNIQGFCRVWTDFYLDYKFRHPDMDSGTMMRAMVDVMFESNYYFAEYIRLFHAKVRAHALHVLIKKYKYNPKEDKLKDFFYKTYPRFIQDYALC